jgi:hypothetical protein
MLSQYLDVFSKLFKDKMTMEIKELKKKLEDSEAEVLNYWQ